MLHKHVLFSLFFGLLSLVGTNAASGQTFRETTCTFDVPSSAGGVICGIVDVPADRTKETSVSIPLSIAILKAVDNSGENLPLVYLHGGPGSSSIRNARKFFGSEMRRDRDLILFDQRGSEYSGRFCPEVAPALFSLMQRDLTLEEQASGLAKVMATCQQAAAAQGIDFTNYKTSDIADDMEAIRKALNIPLWDVWGVSYGTAVGMAAAHLYPSTIHRLVLDSVSLNRPDWRSSTGGHFNLSISRVFALCDEDPACAQRFGSLKENYRKALERLEHTPLSAADVSAPDGMAVLNKHDFILVIHQLLYWPTTIEYIPLLIELVKDGNVQIAANLTRALRKNVLSKSFAAHYAVDCQGRGLDNLQFPEGDNSVNALFPLTAQYKRVCDALAVENSDVCSLPKDDAGITKSKVPTLILTGSLDPITPPPTALIGADEFVSAPVIELPFLGHAVTLRNGCARKIMRDFFAEQKELDTACVAAIPRVSFASDVMLLPEIFGFANDILVEKRVIPIVLGGLFVLTLLVTLIVQVKIITLQAKTAGGSFWCWAQATITMLALVYAVGLVSAVTYTGANNKMLLVFGLPQAVSFLLPLAKIVLLGGIFWTAASGFQMVQRRALPVGGWTDVMGPIAVLGLVGFFSNYGL